MYTEIEIKHRKERLVYGESIWNLFGKYEYFTVVFEYKYFIL